jgi:peroxiredoxin
MVATPSTMLPLGTQAPSFSLPNSKDNQTYNLVETERKGLLIAFICNHCPYVLHLLDHFTQSSNGWLERGIEVLTISSNDVEKYPADHPEKMSVLAHNYGFPFPYLYDASQEVARAYRAACTPDFFLFDKELRLFYRGQYDASRPGFDQPVNGENLGQAVECLLNEDSAPQNQVASLGCNIKWKPGNEPTYFSC